MKHSNKGYTLIELLIAIAIGAIIVFGVTTTFTGSMQTSATAIRTSQFDQELRATMNTITRDLRRAGFSKNATTDVGTGTSTNTFLLDTGEPLKIWTSANVSVLQTTAVPTTTPLTCVTYAFDAAPTPDGVLTASSDDYRGFKLSGGVIYKRTAAATTGQNCSQGTWSQLTTDDLVVDALRFEWRDYTNGIAIDSTATVTPGPTPTGGCTGTATTADNTKILQRVVRVTLTAHSAKDANLTRTLQDDVKVRNNSFNSCGS